MSSTTVTISCAEIMTQALYDLVRPAFLRNMFALKRRRRVELGCASLQFENRTTVLYLVHELVRAHGDWTQRSIRTQLSDCAQLVPELGSLSATLMVHAGAAAGGQRLAEHLAADPGSAVQLVLGDRVIAAEHSGCAGVAGPVHYLRFDVGVWARDIFVDPRASARVVLRDGGVVTTALPDVLRAELAADLLEQQELVVPATGAGAATGTGAA